MNNELIVKIAKDYLGDDIHDWKNNKHSNYCVTTLLSKFLNDIIGDIDDKYVVVEFPEVQEYMEEEWFDDEAILETEGKFGSSAYFIPLSRIIKHDLKI